MDNIFISYLIKVSIALIVFYGFYIICLRSNTFFVIRRIYFLSVALFSIVFPFIKIPIANDNPTQIPAFWLSGLEIELYPVATKPIVANTITGWAIIVGILIGISVIFAIKFLIQLSSILFLKNNSNSQKLANCKIVLINDLKTSPFSFFNWIFINPHKYNPEKIDEIIIHEQVHVKQYHSIDVIFFELLCICLWWNPFIWFIKREMKINLEYLADEGVLKAGVDSKEYQYILLKASNENIGIPFINNFNVSQLKKRITMMNKRKTSIRNISLYILSIPLGLILLLGNAVKASSSEIINTLIVESVQDIQQDPKKKADVFIVVEQMPTYPGGEQAMQEYISNNLKYPVEAQTKGVQGRVLIRFIVGADGNISDTKVIRSVSPETDAEALRVIKSMPKWNPGKHDGKEVPVYFTIPIVYRLKEETPKNTDNK